MRSESISRPLFLSLLSALLFSGCVRLIEPSAVHVSWAQDRWPGTSLADLEQARIIYMETCDQCHPLRSPRRYEPGEWAFAIERMLEGEDVEISDQAMAAIVLYLNAASAIPNEKAVVAAEVELAGD